MSLCRLIHKEIQKISEFKVDPESLDPREYDKLIEQLTHKLKNMKILQKLLSFSSESLDKIDSYWKKKGVNVKNIELKDLFANSVDKICDTTIFYDGDLDYSEYETLNPEAKSLPECLKVIFGKFVTEKTNIEYVDLESVNGRATFHKNPNLTAISIAIVMKTFTVRECQSILSISVQDAKGSVGIYSNLKLKTTTMGNIGWELNVDTNYELSSLSFGNVNNKASLRHLYRLSELTMGDVIDDFTMSYCHKIQLQNIHSHNGEKITINKNFSILGCDFENLGVEEMETKFNVKGLYR